MQLRNLRHPDVQNLEQYWGRRVGVIVRQDGDDEAEQRRKRNLELDRGTARRLDLGRMALHRIWRSIESGNDVPVIDPSDHDALALIQMGAVRLLLDSAPKAQERTARRAKKRRRYDLDLAASGQSNLETARRARRREKDVLAAEADDDEGSWSVSAVDLVCPSPWEISNHVVDKPLINGLEVQVVSEAGLRPARRMIMFGHQAAIGRQALLVLTGTSQALGQQAKHMRMGVVSAGMVKIDLTHGPGHLGYEVQRLQQRISGPIREELARHGMELIFSALEGPLWIKDGVLHCHLHAHMLIVQSRHLGPEAWMAYITGMRRVSPREYYRDAGRVRDLAELTKYVTKGAVSDAEEREATSTGLVRTDIERLTPAQALAFSWSWHRRKRYRWFGRARELQKTMDEQHAKWCREGTETEDGKPVIKVGAVKKGTREVAPTYDRDGRGSEDIILGTSIRAILVDGVRRLAPCVRVMNPSGATMTTRVADLVERRSLQVTADLAARLWQAGLAQHVAPSASQGRDNYGAHKTANSAKQDHDTGSAGPPDLSLLTGGASIAA